MANVTQLVAPAASELPAAKKPYHTNARRCVVDTPTPKAAAIMDELATIVRTQHVKDTELLFDALGSCMQSKCTGEPLQSALGVKPDRLTKYYAIVAKTLKTHATWPSHVLDLLAGHRGANVPDECAGLLRTCAARARKLAAQCAEAPLTATPALQLALDELHRRKPKRLGGWNAAADAELARRYAAATARYAGVGEGGRRAGAEKMRVQRMRSDHVPVERAHVPLHKAVTASGEAVQQLEYRRPSAVHLAVVSPCRAVPPPASISPCIPPSSPRASRLALPVHLP